VSNTNDEYDTDVNIVPSSDDDARGDNKGHASPVGGGWKLIHRRTKKDRRSEDTSRGKGKNNEAKGGFGSIGIGRSKSQVDHSTSGYSKSRKQPRKASSGDGLSPVNELSGPLLENSIAGEMGEDVVLGGAGGASVGRSRTLPSGSTKSRSSAVGAGSGSDREKEKERETETEKPRPHNVLKKKKGPGRPVSLVPPPRA